MINLILKLMESEALKTAFLKLANMSISASWLVLAILVLRLILKKAPKWVNVLLWGIVAVRLICPFTIESALSLIPSTQTIPMNIEMAAKPAIDSGVEVVNSMVNPIIAASFTANPATSANPLQIWIPLAAVIWVLGMVLMLLYTAISYCRLNHRIDTAVLYRDNIFQSENVSSPFVLGIIKPKIYLPFHMNEQDLQHVVAHEQAHILRKDHWWKPLGFLLLTVHWFNPLMWLAYVLLCRDIELACDEKVIKDLDNGQRADYTQALVACSINRHIITACPLAFGEVGVKDRVKSIMNYRKPAFWIIVIAFVACVAVAACFLTNPVEGTTTLMSGEYYICDMLYSHAPYNEENFVPSDRYFVSSDFQLSEKNADGLWVSLGTMEAYPLTNKELYSYNLEGLHRHYPVKKITDAYILRGENDFFYMVFQTKDGNTYLAYGWEDVAERGQSGSDDTGLRRLYQLGPASSCGVTKWFDYTDDPTEMSYVEELTIQLSQFPDITFKYTPHDIIATTSLDESNPYERVILISGMPIWNAYFYDLTGDGLPEICAQASYGSGIIDSRVIIYDYAKGISYKLVDRGNHDYYLRMVNGCLYVDKWIYNSGDFVASGKLIFKDGCIQIEGHDTRENSVTDILETQNQENNTEAPSGTVFYHDKNLDGTYQLMIPVDGVTQIDTLIGNESGSVERADDMPFEKGEKVHLAKLDKYDDLSGLTINAFGKDGNLLFSLSIPEGPHVDPITAVYADGWTLSRESFSVSNADQWTETPDRQKVEAYLIDYTYDHEKSQIEKTDIRVLGLTDHYGLVYTSGKVPVLILYHYTYSNVDNRYNITGIARGEYSSSDGFTINHAQMDNQHIYFGTVNQALWNLKDERTHTLGQISIRAISEEEIVESSFDNQSVYLTVMNAPLKNFEIMDYEGNVLLNLQTYLDQGYVIQEKSILIAALGTNGTRGFVKAEDLDGDLPSNPEEAIAYMEEMERKTAYGTKKYVRLIPLYAEDGVTVIGEFAVG